MRVLKKGNSDTKSIAYTSLVRSILEYGTACWDNYTEEQTHALDLLKKIAAKVARHTKDPNWETLEQGSQTACRRRPRKLDHFINWTIVLESDR
jgi:hypothetical protein